MLRYNMRYQIFVTCSHLLIVIFSMYLSSLLRIRFAIGRPGTETVFTPPFSLYVIAVLIWWFGFARGSMQKIAIQTTYFVMLRSLASDYALSALVFLGALYVTYRDYSRLEAFYFLTLTFIGMLLLHSVIIAMQGRIGLHINSSRRILIGGVSDHAAAIGEKIARHQRFGLHLVGYVALSDEPTVNLAPDQILGSLDRLETLVTSHKVDELIIAIKAYDDHTSDLIHRVMLALGGTSVNIRLSPNYSEHAYFRTSVEDFSGVTLIGLRETILTPVQRVVKRAFDVLLASLLLVICLPLLTLIALLIRLDTEGDVIFRQKRIGQYGQPFVMYKFRTMYANAAQDHRKAAQKSIDDVRITPVGRWLRRSSLDELPQLINILKGDMSVVGPRPEIAEIVDDYVWWQRKRLEVPQGLTGWWQTQGRADRPLIANIDYDFYYIENYSIWLDVYIILRTLQTVLSGRGAY